MINLEFEVSGGEELEKYLTALTKAIDTVEILDEAQALILNRVRTRFLAETDPDGIKWVESGAAKKRRAKGGTGTLFDTGTLFHSIQGYASGPEQRAIGTDVPYALEHQMGIGQVQRVFLGFSEDDAFLVERLVKRRVEDALA